MTLKTEETVSHVAGLECQGCCRLHKPFGVIGVFGGSVLLLFCDIGYVGINNPRLVNSSSKKLGSERRCTPIRVYPRESAAENSSLSRLGPARP